MLQALNLPKKVYFKTGCTPVALRELSEVYHCQRALLVTDPELYRAGIAAPVADLLRKQEIRVAEFFTGLGAPPQECAVTLDDLGRTHADKHFHKF